MSIVAAAVAATGAQDAAVNSNSFTSVSGQTLIASIACAGFIGSSPISDNKGNTTWVEIGTLTSWGPGGGNQVRHFKHVNIVGGSGHVVTFTPTSGYPAGQVALVGNVTSSPTITFQGNADNSGPLYSNSTASSPAAACTEVVFFWSDADSGTEVVDFGGTGSSFSSGDKQNALTDATTGIAGAVAMANKAAGSYTAVCTRSGGTGISNPYVSVISVEEAPAPGSLIIPPSPVMRLIAAGL